VNDEHVVSGSAHDSGAERAVQQMPSSGPADHDRVGCGCFGGGEDLSDRIASGSDHPSLNSPPGEKLSRLSEDVGLSLALVIADRL
jgi:hypothetical protein